MRVKQNKKQSRTKRKRMDEMVYCGSCHGNCITNNINNTNNILIVELSLTHTHTRKHTHMCTHGQDIAVTILTIWADYYSIY